MKIIIKLLVIMTVISCNKKERVIANFNISNVSIKSKFIDSVSHYSSYPNHNNVEIIIKGEIDSTAEIRYGSNNKKYLNNIPAELFDDGGVIKINSGIVNIIHRQDYYQSDDIRILFIPKGSKRGWLKIQSKVN